MTANFGYGQATPTDSTGELNSLIFICKQMIAQISTMKLVQVKTVYGGGVAAAGTVDVIPLVQQIDGNGYGTPHGVVPGIPWSRVQGGTSAIICDPVAGDIGYIIAADRDISKVKNNAGSMTSKGVLPGTRRRFDLADGIYVGACLNVAAPTNYVQFKSGGGLKVVDQFGNVIETSASGIVLTPVGGMPVTVNGNLLVTGNFQLGGSLQGAVAGSLYAGNLNTSGDVAAKSGTGNSVTLSTHKHTQPNDSRGDVEANTNSPIGGT